MTKIFETPQQFADEYLRVLTAEVGKDLAGCTNTERYQALAKLIAQKANQQFAQSDSENAKSDKKKVYYFSLEFLLGPLLDNYLLNYGIRDVVTEGLDSMGIKLDDVLAEEGDPGLGNGGLGRLAACFLDSMAAEGILGFGNGMRYRYGLFRQKIEGGRQVEVTDNWLDKGYPWETRHDESSVIVRFGGEVVRHEDESGKFWFSQEGGEMVKAVPYDVPIIGMDGKTVNRLRLWSAEPAQEDFDLDAFNRGDYAAAAKFRTDAEAISEILYPNDAGEHGRILRLKQEYLFVAAGLASIIRNFKFDHPDADWKRFPELVAIHTNDTHPAMCGAELMRLLVDEEGLDWDTAWDIVTKSISYTNHTVLPEALEKWPIDTFQRLLPRVYMYIDEINRRYMESFPREGEGWQDRLRNTAILWDGQVRMANLSVICSHSVNGVAQIHTDILKRETLHDFYAMTPEKFNNKTNGISPRRFLANANPSLARLITEKIGAGWKKDANELEKLLQFQDDDATLRQLLDIKQQNKRELAAYLKEESGVEIDENSVYDIQIKRLHEYKRQQMNALYIIWKYKQIKAGHKPKRPITLLFGAKAAPAYIIAKDIIHLILCLQNFIAKDPDVSPWLKVVMVENYNITWAERLIPACDISEQISLASKEASGTGNMKFMLNGAVTLGTMDGANVEIHDLVGEENIYIFGKSSETVMDLYAKSAYHPWEYYGKDEEITDLVDFIISPQMMRLGDPENLARLYKDMTRKDWFMALLDVKEYIQVKEKALAEFENRMAWAKKMLVNIAKAGYFSSDRSIAEYNRDIWKL